MWFAWLMYSMRMCEWAKRSLWVFFGSLLMPRDPSESSPYSGSVFVLSFFLFGLHLWAAGLSLFSLAWPEWPRSSRWHRQKTKKPKSCWVFGKWTQRPHSSLSRGWKSSSLLAQCDITCLNYYHRNNSDVISFTLLNWLMLWRGLIRMW